MFPQREPFGTPIPEDERVFRFGRPSKDFERTGKISPKNFELSDIDKAEVPPRLSVWVAALTTWQQAHALRHDYDPTQTASGLVLFLSVSAIQAITAGPDYPDIPSLQVVRDPLFRLENGQKVLDTRVGASGHASVLNIQVQGVPNASWIRRSFRSQLADAVMQYNILPGGLGPTIV